MPLLPLLLGLSRDREVLAPGGVIEHGPEALGVGLHPEEHPAHVRVVDNRHARRLGIPEVGQVRALEALLGVLHGIEVGPGGGGQPLHPHADARLVHEDEHDHHPLVLFAEQLGVALAVVPEVHEAGGRSVNPHLVLDAADVVVVALAEGAVFLDQELGDDEYGDALGSGGRALDPGEHRRGRCSRSGHGRRR